LTSSSDAGVDVHAIGKVGPVFAGRGVAYEHHAARQPDATAAIDRLLAEGAAGLVFANLVDTDQVYGHRKDVEGFAAALREMTPPWRAGLRAWATETCSCCVPNHGCDPAHPGTDHTREYSPCWLRSRVRTGGASMRRWRRRRLGPALAHGARVGRTAGGALRNLSRVPELPEVETIRRHLAPHVEGRVIERLEVLDPRWCEPAPPEELAAPSRGAASSACRGAASTSTGSSRTRCTW